MTRRTRALIDRADALRLPVNVASPGNAHLIACECGHSPDDHVEPGGCLVAVGDAQDVFCPCEKYEVAR